MNGHGILVAAGASLVALQTAKLVGTVCAIRWIVGHGQDFTRLLKANEHRFSEQVYWELLDETNARIVPPLGVLEYRLFRFVSRTKPLVGRTVRLARALLYDFTSLGLASIAFLYTASAPMLSSHAGGIVTWLATASATLVVSQLLAIYAEACVSYAKLGSYGLAFHKGSRYVETRKFGSYITEIKTLAGAVIYSLVTGSSILYFAASHGGQFASLDVSATTFKGTMEDLLNCSYFSLTTFFAADTAGPITGPARAATAALVAQAVCAVILAFSTFALYTRPQADPIPLVAGHTVEPTVRGDLTERHELAANQVNNHHATRPASFFLTGVFIGVVGAAIVRATLANRRRVHGPPQ